MSYFPGESNSENEGLTHRNQELEKELHILKGIIFVMREDLNIKNEQFDFLYASLKASEEQRKATKEQEEFQLLQRLQELEEKVRENDRIHELMKKQLNEARFSSSDRILKAQDPFECLPSEIVSRIISFVDFQALCCGCQVNHLWYNIMASDLLWKKEWSRMFVLNKKIFELVDYKDSPNSFDDANEIFMVSKTSTGSEVKKKFANEFTIDMNWKKGNAEIFTLNGHSGTVTCMSISSQYFVSGSDDGSLILWSMETQQPQYQPPPALPLMTMAEELSTRKKKQQQQNYKFKNNELHEHLKQVLCSGQQHLKKKEKEKSISKLMAYYGHGGPVWCVDFDPITERVVSGSYDTTLKVWDMKSGKCTSTMRGHHAWVSCVAIFEDKIVSGSWDATIKLWDSQTGETRQTILCGVGNPVYCLELQLASNSAIVGCRQRQAQIYNLETGQLSSQYFGHTKEVHALSCPKGSNIMATGSGDCTIKVWDLLTDSQPLTLIGHTGAVMALQYDGNFKVISGSYDKTLKYWDIRMPLKPVTTFFDHSSAVFCLKFTKDTLLSGSSDRQIKVHNFRDREKHYHGFGSGFGF